MDLLDSEHVGEGISSILKASNFADSTLLITGSTGTGKSHLALALHKASLKRAHAKWAKVNLATLSENLIESELFGHERGAFTGADCRRTGKLEICNGGTIFLDEIGELSMRLQAKLLDFIQYKRITPVGSNREIELDVRIIAATNRNLEAAVRAGEFRADLFHRLNVFHVRLPDLAMNPRSVIQLARRFLTVRAAHVGKPIRSFSKEAEQLFRLYSWPGNIRELENSIEFAVAMEMRDSISLGSLPTHLQEYAREHKIFSSEMSRVETEEVLVEKIPTTMSSGSMSTIGLIELPVTMSFHESKDAFERAYLEQMLRLCRGHINLTSRRIGLNKVSLTEKLKRHSIDWRRIKYETMSPQRSLAVQNL
jgi:DNA-binding NtrC family response regulator